MKPKEASGLVSTAFWICVVVTLMLSWSAILTLSDSALTMAFSAGGAGLIMFLIAKTQEES